MCIMDKKLLTKAAEQGIITTEQVLLLLKFFQTEQSSTDQSVHSTYSKKTTGNSGEQLKFIRSFGDVFITLGVILLAYTSHLLVENTTHQVIAIVGFILLAEWLIAHRRLVLPGIAILLSILYFINVLVDAGAYSYQSLDVLLMGLSSLLFYIRYKMPFSLYPVALVCIYLAIELSGLNIIEHPYIFILLGLAVFAVAMWYDSRDTQRLTSLSDNGFWLHLLAAPLIVHGVMVSLFLSKNVGSQTNSLYILLLFILFFFIALFVDRRAILVSSFFYALYAVFKFSYQQFIQVDNLTLFILMGIGLFVIFFGTYWYSVRKLIFSPASSLAICKLVPGFDIKK